MRRVEVALVRQPLLAVLCQQPVQELDELGEPVPRRTAGTFAVCTLRLTPADLVRLRTETDLALADIRTEVVRAETARHQRLREWHADGRAAVEAGEPDTALLSRVLERLRTSL